MVESGLGGVVNFALRWYHCGFEGRVRGLSATGTVSISGLEDSGVERLSSSSVIRDCSFTIATLEVRG